MSWRWRAGKISLDNLPKGYSQNVPPSIAQLNWAREMYVWWWNQEPLDKMPLEPVGPIARRGDSWREKSHRGAQAGMARREARRESKISP